MFHHHEADGWWAESPDVEGWSAAGDSFAEVVKLAEEGVPFAPGCEATLEHYVLAGEHVATTWPPKGETVGIRELKNGTSLSLYLDTSALVKLLDDVTGIQACGVVESTI